MEILSDNKRAIYDYEILEKFEAGLVLQGQEVKSIRNGHIALAGSYIVISQNIPYLVGSKVAPYQPNNTPSDYNQERQRKLLLSKKEINYLAQKSKERGFSLIPLKIYSKDGRIKLEFGLAKGRKEYNKKEKIKKRDTDREVNRELNQRG